MGSSECGGVKNGGAGSIVWVRRRNGSWWPGKILGPDELSASHLMSPRSGTPVKLLGREDASVDWYNLEKSKRVKAFRCGEFDDCIERAEASFGLPAKKREKYARREDAILHALELEKQFLERKFGKVGRANTVREHSPDSERKDLIRSSGILENGNENLKNHEFCRLERTVDVSNLTEMKSVPQNIHKVQDGTHQSLKEHGIDMSYQMRDISSFGLKSVPINSMSPNLSVTNRPNFDGHAHGVPAAGPCFENSSDSDTKSWLGKRKRSLDDFVEESFPKRRDRLHPIDKIWKNNAELHDNSSPPKVYRKGLPVDGIHDSMYLPSELHEIYVTKQGNHMEMPISRPEVGPCRSRLGGFVANATSGSSEETESDSSETHSLEAHVEAGAMLSDAETCIRTQSRMLNRLQVQVGHESTSSEKSSELPLDSTSQFYFNEQSPVGGVSKWQLKGKRNIRNINTRPIDRFSQGMHFDSRVRSLTQGGSSDTFIYSNDTDYMEDNFDPYSQGFNKGGYLPSLAQTRQNFIGHNMIHLEELTRARPLRGFGDDRGLYVNTMFGSPRYGHELLIDVDLKVQANRQGGEHVPWVSLMSRLNGMAIIGHPIQIETLEDGSTDVLVSTSDACSNLRYDIDRSKVPQVWRTAKRTNNSRLPRSQVSSSQLDGDEDDDNEYIYQSGKVRSKKSATLNSIKKGLLMKKNHSPLGTKNPSQKPHLSSSQKVKTLSSIGIDHKFPTKRKEEEETSYHVDGVMKSMNSGPPPVACIPVKLVFSRLLEAVGRPPSAPSKHGVSMNSNNERNPA